MSKTPETPDFIPSWRGLFQIILLCVQLWVSMLQQHSKPFIWLQWSMNISGFFTDPPLLLALQTIGADRIIFSVDYPYSTNEQGRVFLDSASISPADKKKISHLNAERFLKLAQA